MATTTLPETYPLEREDPLVPSSWYHRIRAEEPIHRMQMAVDGSTAWVVTRHADAQAILRDPRFSSNYTRQGYPGRVVARPPGPGVLTTMDPPDHTRVRKVLANELRPQRVHALAPAIQEIAELALTEMVRGPKPADLVERYALPFALLSLCKLLGVPGSDAGVLRRVTAVMDDRSASATVRQEARNGLVEYLRRLAAAKEKEPSDDLLGRLIHDHESIGTLTRDETIGLVTLVSLVGFESVTNQIALAVLVLDRYPEQRAALSAEPAKLDAFMDELLRHQTVIDFGVRRVATDDVEISGRLVREGEGVLVCLGAVNRDPDAFPDPDRFDLGRGANAHLAFGHGAHQCTAAMLALTELRIGLSTLLNRLPGLKPAIPVEQVRFRRNMFVHGAHELPVTW